MATAKRIVLTLGNSTCSYVFEILIIDQPGQHCFIKLNEPVIDCICEACLSLFSCPGNFLRKTEWCFHINIWIISGVYQSNILIRNGIINFAFCNSGNQFLGIFVFFNNENSVGNFICQCKQPVYVNCSLLHINGFTG